MKDYDIYRDSYLRYLGYANEVGEAFRPLIKPILVNASYLVSTGYVFADAIDKSLKEHKKGSDVKRVAYVAGDVFTWQIIASVIVPGITINRITWLTLKLLKKYKAPSTMIKTIPTLLGLCSVPFIIGPIDHATDRLMDSTFRKFGET